MQISVLPDIALGRGESRLQALRTPGANAEQERERLRGAAKEFEGIMLEMMVKAMRKTVPESPIFGRDNGQEIFTEMLDSQYVRLMVSHGGLGLSDLLVQQFERR